MLPDDNLKTLIAKYNSNIPRYTSYPTAVEFKQIEGSPDGYKPLYLQSLNTLHKKSKDPLNISLYIHLPHCASLCYFCACNKIISTKTEDKKIYLEFLKKEFQILKSVLPQEIKVIQVHLGGGSPSFLNTEELKELDNIILLLGKQEFPEKSIEADPRTFNEDKLCLVYDQGYRRFSLGVQDFDLTVQEIINRLQPFEMVESISQKIRSYPETSLNFDLIYGLPGQTLTSLEDTIKKVTTLRPDRIALYGYAHVNWKTKVQNVFNKQKLPSPEERISFFKLAAGMFENAGYNYIGLDHFALPEDSLSEALSNGTLRRNFMGYTTVKGDFLLGTGVSAISDLNSCLIQNEVKIENYHGKLESGKLPLAKIINRSNEDMLRAWIIEKLMCQRILDKANLINAFPDSEELCDSVFRNGINKMLEMSNDGLVRISDDKIEVTKTGSYFLRQIASVFDTFLHKAEKSEKRFSAGI